MRTVEGSGAGVGGTRMDAAGDGGVIGVMVWVAVVGEVVQVEGRGGGVLVMDVVWFQFATEGVLGALGVSISAAGAVTIEAEAVGAAGIV